MKPRAASVAVASSTVRPVTVGTACSGVVRALDVPEVLISAIANDRVSSAVIAPSFVSNSVGPK